MGGIGGQIEGLDPDRSCFAMGQSAGGVRDVLPAGEIVRRIMEEAEAAIGRVAALRAQRLTHLPPPGSASRSPSPRRGGGAPRLRPPPPAEGTDGEAAP